MSTSPDWIYYVLEPHRSTAKVIEFKKITSSGIIKATTHAAITLSTKGYRPVRILSQDKHDSTLKVARDAPILSKNPLTFWIFETGFIQEFPWDPGEWHWQATRRLALLRIHSKKRIQERSDLNAHAGHEHLHPRT
jgi:predicted metal-dependent HD superfamily phosphohydrolase